MSSVSAVDRDVGVRRIFWRVAVTLRTRPALIAFPWLASVVATAAPTALVWAAGGLDDATLTSDPVLISGTQETWRMVLLAVSWMTPLLLVPYLVHVVAAGLAWPDDRYRALRVLPLLRASVRDLPHTLLAAAALAGSVLAGLIMLIVPGYIALVWGAYMIVATVVERPRPAWRSWGISRDLAGVGGVEAAGLLTGMLCVTLMVDGLLTALLAPLCGSLTAGLVINPLLACVNVIALTVLYFRLRELRGGGGR